MNSEDIDYGYANPFALTRYLKNSCRICPKCRKECVFDAGFDQDREIINLVAICDSCGKTALVPVLDADENLSIRIKDSDDPYEPDRECFELKEKLGDATVPGSGKETLALFSGLSEKYADTRRISASIDLSVRIVGEYRKHIGEEGWGDALDDCFEEITRIYNRAFCIDKLGRVSELLKEFLPLAEGMPTAGGFRIRDHYAESLSRDDPNGSIGYRRKMIDELESMKRCGTLGGSDIYLIRSYESLGMCLLCKGDSEKSFKALKKAFDQMYGMCEQCGDSSETLLMELVRITFEFSEMSALNGKLKRGIEAAKNCVRICSRHRSECPFPYAAAVIGKAKLVNSTDSDIPPALKDEMDGTIEFLENIDDDKKYTYLATAYFLRSSLNDKDIIETDYADKGCRVIQEGFSKGLIPETIASASVTPYITYLDSQKDPKADRFRKEFMDIGISILPSMDSIFNKNGPIGSANRPPTS